MNIREMDIIARIEFATEIGSALRNAHIIHGLVNARWTAEDMDAEQGDIKRAAERDEELYLSVLREQEGSGR